MQVIEGDDLEAMRRQRGGWFSLGEVLAWADQLLDALDYLHTREPPVVHRDIKPQNLKLMARGQIILLDFGLAKGSSAQATSFFGFTRMYAPLEQMQGVGTDPRSDLYSLAATLYHLLTGTAPPDALSRATVTTDGDADPLLPAHQLSSQISPHVSTVLDRAMSRARPQRFQSAAEMRRALSEAVAASAADSSGWETTVTDPPPVKHKPETSQRRRWDEDSFFTEAGKHLTHAELDGLRRLYDFSLERAYVAWGSGTQYGSFSAKFEYVNSNKSLYTVFTNGALDLNFGWLNETPQGRAAAEKFGSSLRRLRDFNIPADFMLRYVRVPATSWVEQLPEFMKAVEDVTQAEDSGRAAVSDGEEETVVSQSGRRSGRGERLLRFWDGILALGRGRTVLHDRLSKPVERNYVVAGAGIGGLLYAYNIFRHSSRVEFYLSRQSAAANKRMFDELLSHKDEIESAFGGPLFWQRLDGKTASRISHGITGGGLDDDEARWPAIQTSMIDAMTRLERAIPPFIPKLMGLK